MEITEIGYLTDVEGNYDYFQKYIELSQVLAYTDNEKTILKLKDNAMFVFGGMLLPFLLRKCGKENVVDCIFYSFMISQFVLRRSTTYQ